MKTWKKILLWGWPVILIVLLVGFLVPFPQTVSVRTDGVIWKDDAEGETLLDHAELVMEGHFNRYLFRGNNFSGTVTVTPENDDAYAVSCEIEKTNYEKIDGAIWLGHGYSANQSPRILMLRFDPELQNFDLYDSCFPDGVHFTAPAETLEDVKAAETALFR